MKPTQSRFTEGKKKCNLLSQLTTIKSRGSVTKAAGESQLLLGCLPHFLFSY